MAHEKCDRRLHSSQNSFPFAANILRTVDKQFHNLQCTFQMLIHFSFTTVFLFIKSFIENFKDDKLYSSTCHFNTNNCKYMYKVLVSNLFKTNSSVSNFSL